MKIKNNTKTFNAVIISTFLLGVISFGLAMQQDYNNIEANNGQFHQPSSYLIK